MFDAWVTLQTPKPQGHDSKLSAQPWEIGVAWVWMAWARGGVAPLTLAVFRPTVLEPWKLSLQTFEIQNRPSRPTISLPQHRNNIPETLKTLSTSLRKIAMSNRSPALPRCRFPGCGAEFPVDFDLM